MGGTTRARSPTNTTPKYAALIGEKVLSTLLAQGSEQEGAVSQKQGRKISDWVSRFQDRGCDIRVLPVGIEKTVLTIPFPR